jgi:hypothetical protein
MPFEGEVIYDIAMILNTTTGSQPVKPGGMWWILPTGYTPTEVVEYFGIVFQYDPGVPLLPGFHLFGVIQITERRLIRKSFFEMMGFSPVSVLIYFISGANDACRHIKCIRCYPLVSLPNMPSNSC